MYIIHATLVRNLYIYPPFEIYLGHFSYFILLHMNVEYITVYDILVLVDKYIKGKEN